MGDLLNWELFLQKYNLFIENLEHLYHIENYDKKKELDELKQLAEKMKKEHMIIDTIDYMHKVLHTKNKRIIAEGANATMLDLDFGTYPFITSSTTTAGGVSSGLGVPPSAIETTIGIIKAYTTRVGGGPFPTECLDETGEKIRKIGHEFGATTGRPRRCGWLDLNVVKYSNKINGLTAVNMTKLDVLTGFPKIKVGVSYDLNGKTLDGSVPANLEDFAKCKVNYIELDGWKEDISQVKDFDKLPKNAQKFVKTVEKELGVPIMWIGTGPAREAMIKRN